MAAGHKSPQSSLPPLAYKTVNTTTWGAGGNSSVISDTYIKSNSFVVVQVTGATPQSGFWTVTIANGSVTIRSSSSESSTLPVAYIVL